MPRKRLVVQIGRGTDLRGRDYTKAAVRGLENALHRNSLTVAPLLGYPREAMEVEITVAVARPEAVDAAAVAAVLPYGQASVALVRGGLDVVADQGDGAIVIANVAAVVWLDVDVAGALSGVDHGATDAGDANTPVGASSAIDARAGAANGPRTAAVDEGAMGGHADDLPARLVVETGSGADLRGEDDTKAARRAVSDALRHSSLSLFGSLGIDPESMLVELRIGVQRPAAIDVAALAADVPHGRVSVVVERGGLDVHDVERGTRIVVAAAAVLARLPLPPGRFVLGSS